MSDRLTHIDASGQVSMVDIGTKDDTVRIAIAEASLDVLASTIEALSAATLKKGDAFTTAKIAAISAAKMTSHLIPLCHHIPLTVADVAFHLPPLPNAPDHPEPPRGIIAIRGRAQTLAATGVEMEALTLVSVAALTLYDMCKAVDKTMLIGSISLRYKSGGRSGCLSLPSLFPSWLPSWPDAEKTTNP